ncbi:MAG: DUF5057 domain-containing protein [Lachnospiraceae bacterium]|nr:DUF5057 domain-containing protein [Lachnospiraceae bacterium]
MKAKTARRIAAGLSACLIATSVGYFGGRNKDFVVQAKDTLYGIENLKEEVRLTEGRTYTILELVPNESASEIGYLIPGYEPAISTRNKDTGEWTSWQQNLSQCPTAAERSQYMKGLKEKWSAFLTQYGLNAGNAPVVYEEYEESETEKEGYHQLSFAEQLMRGYFDVYDESQLEGEELEKQRKEHHYLLDFYYDGIYSDLLSRDIQLQHYYATAQQVTAENIASLSDDEMFYTLPAQSPYVAAATWGDIKAEIPIPTPEEFDQQYRNNSGSGDENNSANEEASENGESTNNEDANGNGESSNTEEPGDNGEASNTENTGNNGETSNSEETGNNEEGAGNQEPTDNENSSGSEEQGTVSNGDAQRESLTDEELLEVYQRYISESSTIFYYHVQYHPILDGMTVAEMGQTTDRFPIYAVNTGSIRISEVGNYRFIASEDGQEYAVSTSSIYYKGGFINREWFREKVLDMDSQTDNFDDFPVKVVTMTVEELNAYVQNQEGALPPFDLLYINSGLAANGQVGYAAEDGKDISENAEFALIRAITSNQAACLLDAAILYSRADNNVTVRQGLQNTRIFYLSATLSQEHPSAMYDDNGRTGIETLLKNAVSGSERNFVAENVYSFFDPVKLLGDDFAKETIYNKDSTQVKDGFQAVLDEIVAENQYRAADQSGTYKALGTYISRATVIRHVINYKYRRNVAAKKVLNILDIEPAKSSSKEEAEGHLNADMVRSWIGEDPKAENKTTINITRMTTAEYIGKIEDINELYDMVYIGVDREHMNTTRTGSTVFNDSNMDGLIYYHTGDKRYVAMELAGLLDTEYLNSDRRQNVYYYNPTRYGGNDITLEKMNALNAFLDASYPVVVADEFFESPVTLYEDIQYKGYSANLQKGEYTLSNLRDEYHIKNDDVSSLKVKKGYQVTLYQDDDYKGASKTFVWNANPSDNETGDHSDMLPWVSTGNVNWNDQVSSIKVEQISDNIERVVDADHIDNSSYMYQFVNEALKAKRTNFYASSDISANSESFNFYLNRPKVNLENLQVNGVKKDQIYQLDKNASGQYVLSYTFTLTNEGAASNSTEYGCELYIDVNADGKFSDTEKMSDIAVAWNGQTLKSGESLYAGRTYTLTRTVPKDYKGVLPWKVLIIQKNNSRIHNSVQGYTKLMGQPVEVLDIIQICRDTIETPNWWGGKGEHLFNLEELLSTNNNNYYKLVHGGTIDKVWYDGIDNEYDIRVKFYTISQFERAFNANPDILEDYGMLILGFSDAYGDFSKNACIAIQNYIESGRSVLFAHDTLMYWNYDEYRPDGNKRRGITNRNNNDTGITDQYRCSYNLTKQIRGLVGMDRYGVMAEDMGVLRTGTGLNAVDARWDSVVDAGKDMAYTPKDGRQSTVPETQGFTYAIINAKDKHSSGGDSFSSNETGLNYTFTNKYLNIKYDQVYYSDKSNDYGEIPAD